MIFQIQRDYHSKQSQTVTVQPLHQTHVEIKIDKMENFIEDSYCGLCSLQFGNKIVFDMQYAPIYCAWNSDQDQRRTSEF